MINKNKRVLILGNSPFADAVKEISRNAKRYGTDCMAKFSNYSSNPGIESLDRLMPAPNLFNYVIDNKFNTVVVTEPLNGCGTIEKQLLDLKFANIAIFDAPNFYEALTGRVPIGHVGNEWFLFRNQGRAFSPAAYRIIKQVMDFTIALLGTIISIPIMTVITILIKLSSPGPVFFRQQRLGKNEQPFTLIKFRTMCVDAEKSTGPKWACHDDPRINKVGKILRRTRLDELPQLLNVLKGDMSLIGPRPIRRHFADLLAKDIPFYRLRFIVKPGITGWAQVKSGYGDSLEGQKEKLEYDLYYIQNQSIFLDCLIFLKTFHTLLSVKGQ